MVGVNGRNEGRSKSAFWQALLLSIFVFLLGLMLGFFLENSRANSVEINALNSEINLLDEQLRNDIFKSFDIGCSESIQSTFEFADKIFWEAQKLSGYDDASKFPDSLEIVHKRYDLLRMILWQDSIELRERCSGEFHIVVYFFEYGSDDINKKSLQLSFSRLLLDLKNKYPGDILLIPIAGNLELESVDLVLDKYDIEKLPAVVVDEEVVVRELVNIKEFENIVFSAINNLNSDR